MVKDGRKRSREMLILRFCVHITTFDQLNQSIQMIDVDPVNSVARSVEADTMQRLTCGCLVSFEAFCHLCILSILKEKSNTKYPGFQELAVYLYTMTGIFYKLLRYILDMQYFLIMPSSSDYKALIISMNCIYPVIKAHNIWYLNLVFVCDLLMK